LSNIIVATGVRGPMLGSAAANAPDATAQPIDRARNAEPDKAAKHRGNECGANAELRRNSGDDGRTRRGHRADQGNKRQQCDHERPYDNSTSQTASTHHTPRALPTHLTAVGQI
jgi:hypothetical protein